VKVVLPTVALTPASKIIAAIAVVINIVTHINFIWLRKPITLSRMHRSHYPSSLVCTGARGSVAEVRQPPKL